MWRVLKTCMKSDLSLRVRTDKSKIVMTKEELAKIGCCTLDELITEDFGEVGTPERTEFEFIQLSTLSRLFSGLGRRVAVSLL